tara:strand:+ start:368 stop:1090 length:723 start_codon:yes stop_codon:yes gene_type:complete
MDILFDIVIPVGPNDTTVIHNMIKNTKKNIIGYRNIYLVSYDPTILIDNCITVDEKLFPFNKQTISDIIGYNDRVGWYLQQLIKLYASFVIVGILDNYLVIDSDTYFLRPTSFFLNKLPLYNPGSEYHLPYFNQMSKLHPSLSKKSTKSGISHHMLFQKKILIELFKLVELYHNTDFWKAFLLSIDKRDILGSGASEYEIYFNFLHIYYNGSFIVRTLKWENTAQIRDDLDYISCHWYMR